ncbi:phosphopyruvate hydratase [candidate division TA06 bacterium]|uniref:Enolase n=1 Tax=candidate division TA06 bacterium TaxID=2250710 RepID=A0A523UXM7_UNCT6|nr:MAG: phosphopyruvate hydratase [candidate division TA06 bacterium]
MSEISKLRAREILDSRGNPTVEVDVELKSGVRATASAPSGASTGKHEAVELRDKDPQRYFGKGVMKAVSNVNEKINEAIVKKPFENPDEIDRLLLELDKSKEKNKSTIGANATCAVSMAVRKAVAAERDIELFGLFSETGPMLLPVPMINIINGGRHASSSLDVQEFMVVPDGASTFSLAIRMASEIFHALKLELENRGLSTLVGDEGGFAPDLESNQQALDLVTLAIEKAGYEAGKDAHIAIDVAASELYESDKYVFRWSDGSSKGSDEMIHVYEKWIDGYPIISIEDGLAEDDWKGWKNMTEVLGKKVQLVGDDIFVTNTKRLERGFAEGICNSVLVKVNQIGTVMEAHEVVKAAFDHGYNVVVSHRSGETEDSTIADLAVGWAACQIKSGSTCRSERLAKYNRILRIEDRLGTEAKYCGKHKNPYERFSNWRKSSRS